MKLPRNLSGADVLKALGKVGYRVVRQKGSHIRLTTERNGTHNVTVPDHKPIRIGTLSAIFKDVANHLGMERQDLLDLAFGSGENEEPD